MVDWRPLAQRSRTLVGRQLDPRQTQPEGPGPTRQLLQQSSRHAAGSAGDITCHMAHKQVLILFQETSENWLAEPPPARSFQVPLQSSCGFPQLSFLVTPRCVFLFFFLSGHLVGGHMHQLGILHARCQVNMQSDGSRQNIQAVASPRSCLDV